MDFPAIMEEEPHQQLPLVEITDPLTLAIKTKFQSIKKKKEIKYKFTKNYHIIDLDHFNQLKEKFLNYLKEVKDGQTQGFQQFYPLIFGLIEGTSSNMDPTKILGKYFGSDIEKLQLIDLIKQKTKSINYGLDKRRDSNIRQISDKKIFQSISAFLDLKQIKAHRKNCNSVKNYLKAHKKFKDCIENSIKTFKGILFTEDSEQNKSYMQFVTEELAFNKLKLPNEFVYEKEQELIEEQEQNVQKSQIKSLNILQKFLTVTPLKELQLQNNQKHEKTAQTQPKSSDNQKKQNQQNMNNEEQNNEQKGNMEQKQSKNKKQRRSKEQVQRDRIAKQKQKQQRRKQEERKRLQKIAKQNQLLKQKQEKERQKQQQRIAKQKQKQAKQRQKQEKQRERQAQKQAKQAQRLLKQKQRQEKEDERLAKQAERLALQKLKQEKQKKQKQIMKRFFKKPAPESPQKKMQVQALDQEKPVNRQQSQKQKQSFLSLIKSQSTDINKCRSEFKFCKMKDQTYVFQPYYTNVITSRSRLQFKNYRVNDKRFEQYFQPYFEAEICKYDDSSVEYEDICGDICNQQVDLMSVQDEQGSYNSAIVNDSYVSQEELSSAEDQRNQVFVKISQGAQWYFSDLSHKYVDQYTMFCLYDDELLPLPLNQPQQSNEPPINLKCQLYKQIHGYFGPKEPLIKKMASIADRIPKSSLDTMLRQTTTKKGNQRLVKPQIIDFLNDQKEGFTKQLEQIKLKRDEENIAEMRDKVSQKQRQIQRLILNEAGTYYIIDLLHFLREKGYRMRKRDLTQFIDARRGSQWDDIRKRMKKMNLKEKQKINKYFNKDKDGKDVQDKDKQDKDDKEDRQKCLIYEQNAMKPE